MRRLFLAASLSLLLPAAASAQDVASDVKCMVLSNAFAAGEKDPARKTLAQQASYYYLGRVDSRLNQAQLKAQIVAASKSVTKESAGPTMTACAQRLGGQQKMMMTIGQELAAQQPKPAAAPAKK